MIIALLITSLFLYIAVVSLTLAVSAFRYRKYFWVIFGIILCVYFFGIVFERIQF